MSRLLAGGRTVMLETGGHRPIDRVPAAVVKIVDVKCPGSGEAGNNEWRNLDRLLPHDQVKFVVKDRTDYEFARDVARRHDLAPRCAAVLISPVHGELDARTLSEWMLADRSAGPIAATAAQVHLAPVHTRRMKRSIWSSGH